MKQPDFRKLAEEALQIEPPRSSGQSEHNRLMRRYVDRVQAQLAMVYGMGIAQSDGRER